MAAPAQVTWAKAARNGAEIVAIGGVRKSFFGKSKWSLTAEEAIVLMEQDEWCFFVEVDDEKEWLDVREGADGRKTISADGPAKFLL
ncbi:hypothetical protein KU6B_11390 [Mameliella alba]|uniref:hypothetical protein n=1 Tax=Mameliella alba TaxID=561184 RepID=UPI00088FBA1F|nr:hypothetical protein [Mameliella alba]OWV46511.1 hypothetical protein CDZ96_18045 [Mameliella alba]OWV55466.1 hypothetical protein CDZ98_19080 [Mameliella alba]PTR37325.1 hypothetical protein LX94_03664 [Mameliella alba]SDD75561.1 hypothetical protein SAMN05216376_11199 [Mameliella alba]BBU54874.1 hypothetical protein KU6B_11390 [Mameliella alba]